MKITNNWSNFKIDWKKVAPYLVALVAFIAVAMIYCSPMLHDKVLHAGDVDNWRGTANEAREYYQQHGERTWWTNSMFGGMPTYQVTGSLPSGDVRSAIADAAHLGSNDQNPIGLVFAYFVGFFLMLVCFGVNPWLSIIGAFAIGMSSYFFLIIPAGHITKACALSFLAPVIGGFYAIMRRKKFWLGIPMVLVYGFLGSTLHPQMTYYMGLLMGVLICAELFIHIRARLWKQFGISVGVLALCFLMILGTKWSWMSMNNSYLKQTMRGGHSELTQKDDKGDKQPASGGLSLEYVTDWSYGIDETLTLLVPNMMGGASGYNVGDNSVLYDQFKAKMATEYRKQGAPKKTADEYAGKSAHQLCSQAPTYWGDKQFTSGAVYVGAVVCFLFILGLIIVPGPYKWALLFATLMSIFLAWGRHMMWLTEFFYDYFPMYNKFRTVESILVVAEVTMPLLGFLGLQRIVDGKVEWKKLHLGLWIAGGVLGIGCFILAICGGDLFSFKSAYDERWIGQVGDDVYNMIIAQRKAMLTADAWRSFAFVMLTCAVVYGYAWLRKSFGNKLQYNIALFACLIALVLADMIPVNKRFFNDENFVTQKELDDPYKPQAWEKEILKDKTLGYRVYNKTRKIDQDSRTSYRLKSLSGYSAVKLRRYQDLIDRHILLNNPNVINMLNTKYIITQRGIEVNPDAMGNAWFVENVLFVPTPDDESNALYTLDLHRTAVADEQFRDVLSCDALPTESDVITMTEYQPNKLTYKASNTNDRVAVFSEIYYPEEWHLYVDGKETPIGRVNYVLRAAVIPAGKHTIVMEFVPKALQKDKASYACVILLLLIALGSITWPLWKEFLPKKVKALLAKAE